MRFAELSVIIPTFNRAHLLDRAVSSVLKQTVLPREIIIVDDGSEDSTQKVIDAIEKRSGIKFIYHKQPNRGPAAARNAGIERSSFAVLAFLDSDDHWRRNKIEMQYRVLQNSNQGRISHTREKWLRRGEHLNQKKIHRPPDGYIFNSCTRLCCVGMSTVMIKRTIFEDYGYFDENLRCCEDYDFWLRVSAHEPFLLIDAPLTIKEGGRDDQVSAVYRVGMDKYRIYALHKLLDQGKLEPEKEQQARRMLIKKCEIYGKGCLRHGKIPEGKKMLKMAETNRLELTL